MLFVWLFIRMKRDPQWHRWGLAGATTAAASEARVSGNATTAPVVVPTDR